MNRTELLDGLYSARSELMRLIMASGPQQIDPAKLRQLVQRRDGITWTINAIIDAELLSAVGDIDSVCQTIQTAAQELHHLTDIANDIDKALSYGKDVLDAATGLLKAVPA